MIENFLEIIKCNQLQHEIDNIIDSNKFVEDVDKISVFSAVKNETRVIKKLINTNSILSQKSSPRALNEFQGA